MPVTINGSGSTGSINTAVLPSSGTFATQSYADTAGGLVKIATETFSAVGSVSLNNCFSATYENYRVLVTGQSSASDVALNMRLRVSGTDSSALTYNTQSMVASSTTLSGGRVTSAAQWQIGAFDDDDDANALSIDVFRPNVATRTTFLSNGLQTHLGSCIYLVNGYFDNSTVFDGLTLYPGSGTITGTVRVYGYKN